MICKNNCKFCTNKKVIKKKSGYNNLSLSNSEFEIEALVLACGINPGDLIEIPIDRIVCKSYEGVPIPI